MNSQFVLQPNPSLFNSEIAFSREGSQKWGMGKREIGSVYRAQLLFATSLQQSNTSVIIWKSDRFPTFLARQNSENWGVERRIKDFQFTVFPLMTFFSMLAATAAIPFLIFVPPEASHTMHTQF